MTPIDNFPVEFKHPFLRRYSLLMNEKLLTVECDIHGNWSVSDLETFEYMKKWHEAFNIRFVKASNKRRTYSESLLDSNDYEFDLEKDSPFTL